MATKKHNKRKFAALALALVGVAGLSVASAATLTVDAANEVAIGTDTFAACDTDGVTVDYTYAQVGTDFEIADLTVGAIDTGCNGEPISVVLENTAGTELASVSGSVAAGAYTADVSADAIDIATDLGDVVVIIG
ncbi:hypothetical protein [Demequina muriae]|uniref:Uncharacterized protein n=1 Tax=Demequina muriae TaxID=3051664 RepID=A0ABT8GFU2_9MICO|nr:hypothetical protein [Demequina sp. EGI L300058]MDN4480124.1 hypothetical protein [Demequina sp. EGI L300058]